MSDHALLIIVAIETTFLVLFGGYNAWGRRP
jgi:hypothetical protein